MNDKLDSSNKVKAPILCQNCGGKEYYEEVKDRLESIVCEKERRCKDCKYLMGYWGYGYWETEDEKPFPEWETRMNKYGDGNHLDNEPVVTTNMIVKASDLKNKKEWN